jgi:hypothetical protein
MELLVNFLLNFCHASPLKKRFRKSGKSGRLFQWGFEKSHRVTTIVIVTHTTTDIVETPPVGCHGTIHLWTIWWLSVGWHSSLPRPPALHVIYFPFFTTIRRLRFTLSDSTRSSRHPFSGSSTPLRCLTHIHLRSFRPRVSWGVPRFRHRCDDKNGACLWCHWDMHPWHVLPLVGPLWTVVCVVFWSRFTIKLDSLIELSESRLLVWFLQVSLIVIIKGRYPMEVSVTLIVIIKQVSVWLSW